MFNFEESQKLNVGIRKSYFIYIFNVRIFDGKIAEINIFNVRIFD